MLNQQLINNKIFHWKSRDTKFYLSIGNEGSSKKQNLYKGVLHSYFIMKIRELITRLFARRYIDLAQINSFKAVGIAPFFF